MNRQQIINEGQEAKRILEDETIKNALDEMEADATEAWKDADDPVGREAMWQSVWAVRKFRQNLTAKINAAEDETMLEQMEQDAEKSAKERDA